MTSTAPDGSDWALNSVLSTLLYKESDKPLVGDGTGYLSDLFNTAISSDSLEITSSRDYAAMQQFGGTKEEFPQLWGDIPARPFMGFSDDDNEMILNILTRHINDTWDG